MPIHLDWPDIVLRLGPTVLASAMLGSDREAQGHVAGLRTTVLVGLAAAVAIVQVNFLLPIDSNVPGFFAVLDLMRVYIGRFLKPVTGTGTVPAVRCEGTWA